MNCVNVICKNTLWLMTPTDRIKKKTKTMTKTTETNEKPNIFYIFRKQGVQGYQISYSDQSTGQIFVGQPDQTRPGPKTRICISF